MIKISDPASKYFEEAYFIMRDNLPDEDMPPVKDMVEEANRIIALSMNRKKKKVSGYRKTLIIMSALSFISVALTLILYFIK